MQCNTIIIIIISNIVHKQKLVLQIFTQKGMAGKATKWAPYWDGGPPLYCHRKLLEEVVANFSLVWCLILVPRSFKKANERGSMAPKGLHGYRYDGVAWCRTAICLLFVHTLHTSI